MIPSGQSLYPIAISNPPGARSERAGGQTLFGGDAAALTFLRKGPRTTFQELAADVLRIGCQIPDAPEVGTPESLRKLLESFLKEFERNALGAGKTRPEIERALLALTAWLDEAAMSRGAHFQEFWAGQSLSMDFFGNSLGGEAFFSTLREIIKEGEKNRELWEVFFLCLEFGFRGKYGLEGQQALLEIRGQLAIHLKIRPDVCKHPLSPSAMARTGIKANQAKKRTWIGLCLGTVGAALFLYTLLAWASYPPPFRGIQTEMAPVSWGKSEGGTP